MSGWEGGLDNYVRNRRRALIAYAYLHTSNLQEAEDLVQDALIATFSRARRHTTIESLDAYVRKTILNTYLDGFRRRNRWAAIRHLTTNPDTQTPSDTHTQHHIPARIDIQNALTKLSPRQRACIILRFYEDLTVPAIAAALSLSAGTVKRHLSDAIKRLETELGPLPDAHLDDLDVIVLRSTK